MKRSLISFCSILLSMAFYAQGECSFVKDTLFLPDEKKNLSGEYLEAVLKNNSVLRLYKTGSNRYYLRLAVSENLYFDKTDQLEIQSGSKSMYEPKIKQYELGKATGYYVFEIYKNYIATLKDDGITAIVFGKAKTSFTRQDANKIKDISNCFYETIVSKK